MPITKERRQEIEREIATAIVNDAIAQGYRISINNGGDDDEISLATDSEAILENMFAADFDRIDIFRMNEKHHTIGFVMLVYGNGGYDVIADSTSNLIMESILRGAEDIASMHEEECVA